MERCSLTCNELGSIDFENKRLAISLASLKSLSISFSDKAIFYSKTDAECSHGQAVGYDLEEAGDERRDIDDIRAEVTDEGNFIGIAKLLQLSS